MLDCECKVRLEVIELAAAVVAHALELVSEYVFVPQERSDGVSQLDLAARARGLVLQVMEYARRQDISAHDAERGRRFLRLGLFDDAADAVRGSRLLVGADDAVSLGLLAADVLHGQNGAPDTA